MDGAGAILINAKPILIRIILAEESRNLPLYEDEALALLERCGRRIDQVFPMMRESLGPSGFLLPAPVCLSIAKNLVSAYECLLFGSDYVAEV